MLVFICLWLLQAISVVSAKAFQARRQYPVPEIDCAVTIISYVTVTTAPPTVTVVAPNSSYIAASLAGASTVDFEVVVESSQNAPSGAPGNTIPSEFTNTIFAPAFEATELPLAEESTIYVSDDSEATPTSEIALGETTIIVDLNTAREARATASNGSTSTVTRSSSTTTKSVRANYSTSSSGFKESLVGLNVIPGSEQPYSSGHGQLPSIDPSTSTRLAAAGISRLLETAIIAMPHDASTTKLDDSEVGIVPRQTCVMVSVIINGQWASWCNNWAGSTTFSYTSWQTTVTPSYTDPEASHSQRSVGEPSISAASPVLTSLPTPSMTTTFLNTSTSTLTLIPAASNSSYQPVTPSSTSNPSTSPCGQIGDFDINFDDLPPQAVTGNGTAGFPIIFNPFDHFYWDPNWSYVPPPSDPYPPHSSPLLAVYVPPSNLSDSDDNSDPFVPPGGFGAGPRSELDQYWFNVTSAWVGCQNFLSDSSGMCDFMAQGYAYDNVTQQIKPVVTQHFGQPLCEEIQCSLEQIFFDEAFRGLSALQFFAKVNGILSTFYVDDLELAWYNNTCAAGLMRISSRK